MEFFDIVRAVADAPQKIMVRRSNALRDSGVPYMTQMSDSDYKREAERRMLGRLDDVTLRELLLILQDEAARRAAAGETRIDRLPRELQMRITNEVRRIEALDDETWKNNYDKILDYNARLNDCVASYLHHRARFDDEAADGRRRTLARVSMTRQRSLAFTIYDKAARVFSDFKDAHPNANISLVDVSAIV